MNDRKKREDLSEREQNRVTGGADDMQKAFPSPKIDTEPRVCF